MRLGISGLLAGAPVGSRVGLLTHPAAVLPDLTHGLDALRRVGQPIAAIFGAEHGFRGTAQAGFSEDAVIDEVTGLPVYDTYAMSCDEFAAALSAERIDTLLVDLQHAGARFYTYESSLYDAIIAARTAGSRVVVLDRPNPLGGRCIGGPMLRPELTSFVGRAELPIRHGLTMGELAGFFADATGAPRPSVVPMAGWQRTDLFDDTGLPWVSPSPNLPTAETAHAYPGTCLFEGTNLSVGRGTTTPFRTVGAPWIDGAFADTLRAAELAGVAFRDTDFTPAFNDYSGEHLRGVTLHVTNPRIFDPIAVAVVMLTTVAVLYPGALEFRPVFEKLAGCSDLREGVTAGASASEIQAAWAGELSEFGRVKQAYQLY